jgi:hypothetical protein
LFGPLNQVLAKNCRVLMEMNGTKPSSKSKTIHCDDDGWQEFKTKILSSTAPRRSTAINDVYLWNGVNERAADKFNEEKSLCCFFPRKFSVIKFDSVIFVDSKKKGIEKSLKTQRVSTCRTLIPECDKLMD